MTDEQQTSQNGKTRRDFILLSANAMAGIGAASMAWPLIDSLNPAADVLALSSTEVDLSTIDTGQTIRIKWRGKPVFIRRRTEEEIKTARSEQVSALPDPQKDEDRVKKGKDEWLVVLGVCTHLGCVPLADQGEYNGWFCPCHGSHYDISGRIRKGPAPANLAVPPYEFIGEQVIKIG